ALEAYDQHALAELLAEQARQRRSHERLPLGAGLAAHADDHRLPAHDLAARPRLEPLRKHLRQVLEQLRILGGHPLEVLLAEREQRGWPPGGDGCCSAVVEQERDLAKVVSWAEPVYELVAALTAPDLELATDDDQEE